MAADALDFALRLLRADSAGNGRQRVVVQQRARGLPQLAFGQQLNEPGDVDHDRAAGDAFRVFALQAALRLEQSDLFRQAQVYLAEVGVPDERLLLHHFLPVDLQPLLGR